MDEYSKFTSGIKSENLKLINLKTVLKLEGSRDHEYFEIKNEKTFEIHKIKYEEQENKILKSIWTFDLDKIYEEDINFEDIYVNEIIKSQYFKNLKLTIDKNSRFMKSTLIFLTKFSDSFTNKSKAFSGSFLKFLLNDIMKNLEYFSPHIFDSKPKNNLFLTVSFCDVYENKIFDRFDFTQFDNITNKSIQNNNKTNIKIYDYEDEIVIDGIKEIQISDIEQFDKLIQLSFEKKNNSKFNNLKSYQSSKGLNNEIYENLSHELFTLKIYQKPQIQINLTNKMLINSKDEINQPILITKINLILYRAYTIYDGKNERIINDNSNFNNIKSKIDSNNKKSFQNFTKENFNFFNSINTFNFRSFKLTRCIKDTLESQQNYLFACVPSNLENIILIHDILNNIKKRKTSVITQIIEQDIDENILNNYSNFSKNALKISANFNKSIKFNEFDKHQNILNSINNKENIHSNSNTTNLKDLSVRSKKPLKNKKDVSVSCTYKSNNDQDVIVDFLENTQIKNPNTNEEYFSDIEFDDNDGFIYNKLNLERLKNIQDKKNLEIIFEKFDELIKIDK